MTENEDNKNTEEVLKEFIKESQDRNSPPAGWVVVNGEDLLKMDIPKTEFIVDGLIPSIGITALAGNPGCGKSWLALEIARAVSSNKPLFDKFDTKGEVVLYIDEESNLSEIKRRWTALGADSLAFTRFTSLIGFKIDNLIKQIQLLDFIDRVGYKLVIFDSLRDIHNKNENDSKETQDLIDCFRKITNKGVAVIFLHHNRKENFLNSKDPAQLLRGSSAILAGLDCLISIKSKKISEEAIEFIVSQEKIRQGKPVKNFKVNLIESENKMKFEYIGEIEVEIEMLEKTMDAVMELLEEGEKNTTLIVETLIPLYFSERTIKRAIKELKDAKKIKPRKQGRFVYYSLVPSAETINANNA